MNVNPFVDANAPDPKCGACDDERMPRMKLCKKHKRVFDWLKRRLLRQQDTEELRRLRALDDKSLGIEVRRAQQFQARQFAHTLSLHRRRSEPSS